MEHISLVNLKAQYTAIREEIGVAIRRVVENAAFILGEEVADFEVAFARYVGTKGAVGVASGTAALQLSLRACGVGEGDEVITTAHTFMATAEAISLCNANPVFVDIVAGTYCLDPARVEEAITPRTRAIVAVHLYGQSAEMKPLREISTKHGLWLIEDAAQAHGAEYMGQRCGAIGHMGCFSFYPGKNLGAYGDAGAVTSNDETLLARVRSLRDHGRRSKYEHAEIGFGERLDALQAAILGVKLRHLEAWTELRRAHARVYGDLLANCGVMVPVGLACARHVYHLYVIRTRRREKVLRYLKTHGVQAGVHYPVPLHRQPAYLKQGYGDVHLPVTEQICQEVLSLPMYPELENEQLAYVAQRLEEAVRAP